jgi:YYY domain-containing protein
MFFEWLGREGFALISWWLMASLAGLAVAPVMLRLMAHLPAKGYPLWRPAGLMLVGFIFWFLGNLGMLRNDTGSVLLAGLATVAIGFALNARRNPPESKPSQPTFWQENKSLILATELLFIALFVGWAAIRALNPDLRGTEKPMEMAFLAAVRRADVFPAPDPWMSGYAISYYHFGYILMGTLAKLSGVTNGMAFNLSVALIFALAGTAVFGVIYEMVMLRRRILPTERDAQHEVKPNRANAMAAGMLGVFALLISGNLGMTMLEVPYQLGATSNQYLATIDIKHRQPIDLQTGRLLDPRTFQPTQESGCMPTGTLDPNEWCFYWWWAYSRVVYDRDLGGGGLEVISEQPIFSFILADLHPHVLALPFVAVALLLGLGLVVGRQSAPLWQMALYAIWVGGLLFMNSWDGVFIGFLIGAEALRRLMNNGSGTLRGVDLLGIARFALTLGVLTALFYLPFFIGFRSQVGGIVPNLIFPTRFPQIIMMFGPFFILLAVFLSVEYFRAKKSGTFNHPFAMQVIGFAFLGGLAMIFLVGAYLWQDPNMRAMIYRVVDEGGGFFVALSNLLLRRLEGIPLLIMLAIGLYLVLGRLFAYGHITHGQVITYTPSTGYALLLIGAGLTLVLLPEFLYLRDGFGTRINMIFKLYYQAWMLWSVAVAYGAWSVLAGLNLKQHGRLGFAILLAAFIASGSLYAIFGGYTRTNVENGRSRQVASPMTLDGGPSMGVTENDYAVIQCLNQIANDPLDVVAEATRRGLAYNGSFGRVSALTGIPTLLGWDNHQNQWRGPTFEDALYMNVVEGNNARRESRYEAIETLYNTTDIAEALSIIKRYGITYIYVGPTERGLFRPEGLQKFDVLAPVCAQGEAAVYFADSLSLQAQNQ